MEYNWTIHEGSDLDQNRRINQTGRTDFIGTLDNEALDFSQLEDFINDNSANGNTYFEHTLAHNETPRCPTGSSNSTHTATTSIHLNGGRISQSGSSFAQTQHNLPLPDSPPDSASEPPYSPEGDSQSQNQKQEQVLLYKTVGNAVSQGPEVFLGQSPTVLSSLQSSQQPQIGVGTTECGQLYPVVQTGCKKRKTNLSDDVLVKQEPESAGSSISNPPSAVSPDEDFTDASVESGHYLDSTLQCIRFAPFLHCGTHSLCDASYNNIAAPNYRVDADKGFNFSTADDAFVCQKKNHFQITCHVQLPSEVVYARAGDGSIQKIVGFHLHFYGVKVESPTQTIKVEQSQSDRSKKPFHPVLVVSYCCRIRGPGPRVEVRSDQVTKVTVGRLHFSETTSNNMRKKGKPNPDQRYFYLVVGLHAHCTNGSNYPIVSHASERIIVRASNPGQFESDIELTWQKGQTPESIFHSGRVGVNTDRPDEALVVHGNLKLTGHLVQPSDARAKTTLRECDTREQLRNVQRLRVVQYRYCPEFARAAGLGPNAHDTGVLAQDVQRVLPEAVAAAGDLILDDGRTIDNFLVVNKERIFMENIGAVKELVKVTDNLENRIDELERMNKKLAKLNTINSLSTCSAVSHKYPLKSRRRHDQSFCNNKYIQMIIVSLVLVMAFCMVAIVTLYYIEFQKRGQYQDFTGNEEPIRSSFVKHHLTTQLVKDLRRGSSINPIKTIYSSTTDPEYLPTVSSGSGLFRSSGSSLGRPVDCPLSRDDIHSSECQVSCCYIDTPPMEEVSDHIDTRMFKETNISPSANQWILPTPFYSTGLKSQDSLSGVSTFALSYVSYAQHTFSENALDLSKRVKRSDKEIEDMEENENVENSYSINDNDLSNDVSIIISGRYFNQTLGPEFLLLSHLQENYTYSVIFSKYLADPSIFLTFKMNRVARGHMISYFCKSGDQLNEDCPLMSHRDNSIQIIQEIDNIRNKSFEINISSKLLMNFQFRVPYNHSVQNPCSMPSNRVGLDFIEYNFIYQRSCEE